MAARRRLTRKTDRRGRAYVVDNQTGKRSTLAAYERESARRAKERERERKAEERRERARERAREKAQAAEARRERAQRAAATRKRNAERERRSERSKRYWESEPGRQRRLEIARMGTTLRDLHGRDRNQREALASLIDDNDALWIAFRDRGIELGMTPKQIKDSFFSPRIVKGK